MERSEVQEGIRVARRRFVGRLHELLDVAPYRPFTDGRRPAGGVSAVFAAIALLLTGLPAGAQGLVGRCFDVRHGPWSPAVELDVDSILLGLPSRVRFTEGVPPRARDGDRVLEVAPGALPSVHSLRGWRVVGDSVRTLWSNGYSGVVGSFALSDGSLHGELQTFWDFERVRQSAPARLEPVSCEAPHDPGLDREPSVPRVVTLADGRRIELGASLSTVPGLEEGRGRLSRYIREADVFGVRAEEIRITPNPSGTIRLVVIRFSEDLDEGAFLAGLRERLGPGSVSAPPDGDPEHHSVLWGDRWTRVSYWSSTTTDGRPSYTLMLSDPSTAR